MEDNFKIASASITDRGLSDKRPQNEDSFLDMPAHGIFAVADGVGGAQAGDVASQMATEIIAEAFANKPAASDAEVVMRAAIESANTAIFQMSHDLPQLSTMATTVVALHLEGNIATLGHVGDSRIYRIDGSGLISQETDDHSVVAEEVRAGRMTAEQAAVHPSRNVISRALGAEPTVEVDLKTMMVEPGTSFILCSDGITRHIQDWELESILSSNESLEEICLRLKQICYDRGAEDNLTAVVVKITNEFAVSPEVSANTQPVNDIEEDTVASARSPFDQVAEPIVFSEPLPAEPETPLAAQRVDETVITEDDEILQVVEAPTALKTENGDILDLASEPAAAALDAKPFELDLDETEAPASASPAESDLKEPAIVEPVLPSPSIPVETTPFQAYPEPAARSGFFGSFLTSLLLLAFGALLGTAAMYWFFVPKTTDSVVTQQQQHPTPDLIPRSDNPPLTGFEESRRLIDADAEKYLEANRAWDPDASAADLYLKGRAFLRIGQYFEAQRALNAAKKQLKNDEPDAATLDMEISLALAVVNDAQANEAVRKDLDAWKNSAQPPANGTSNSNQTNANVGVNR
jgi:PPM family protein phosphatase